MKFTAHGSVELTMGPAPRGVHGRPDDDRAMVAFTVRDTGIGIAPDKLAMIFEAFQQADGTTSRKYGGTGLGLSISRELARLLGGAITVSSRPGAGSEFTLTCPTPRLRARHRCAPPRAARPTRCRPSGSPRCSPRRTPATACARSRRCTAPRC